MLKIVIKFRMITWGLTAPRLQGCQEYYCSTPLPLPASDVSIVNLSDTYWSEIMVIPEMVQLLIWTPQDVNCYACCCLKGCLAFSMFYSDLWSNCNAVTRCSTSCFKATKLKSVLQEEAKWPWAPAKLFRSRLVACISKNGKSVERRSVIAYKSHVSY